MSKTHAFFYLTAIAVFLSSPAFAGQSPWATTENARMRMITAMDSIGAQDTFEAALHMKMDKGWHSYWRVPGDSGAPPRFDWGASENVANVEVSWQAPTRYDEFGFQTFGYSDDVYFPLLITLEEPSKPAKLNVNVQTMVCNDICIPQAFTMGVTIPAGEGVEVAEKKIIDFEKRRVPVMEDTANLKIDVIIAGPDALVINAYAKDGFDRADIFATAPDFAFTITPEITVDANDPRMAMIKLPKPDDIDDLNGALQGQEISITLVNGRNAIEKRITF